jgi:hypothetical protein
MRQRYWLIYKGFETLMKKYPHNESKALSAKSKFVMLKQK